MIEVINDTAFLAAIMTIFTGVDEILFGILRGLGQQHTLTVIYVVAFYIVCLPCSYVFTQVVPLELNGMMVALIIGTIVAIVPMVVVSYTCDWKAIKHHKSE